MSDCICRIEKAENGFEVEILDDEVQAKNQDPKSKAPWVDPWKSYLFNDIDGVVKFLQEKLPKLTPESDAEVFKNTFTSISEKE